MASLTLDNVPEQLIKRLEQAAIAHHRPLHDEVVDRLDESFGAPLLASRRDHAELAELALRIRGNHMQNWLTPEFIRMARDYGRE